MTSQSQAGRTSHRTAYSAGGVIYRISGSTIEVALIATGSGGRWGLPKGHVQRGELAPQIAEVDDAQWFTLDVALSLASFEREREVLGQVHELWSSNQL
jgi:hypothetical protein